MTVTEEAVEALTCCAGVHMPSDPQCNRRSRELVLALPSADMIAVPAWQVYPLCGVYHMGEALAKLILRADPSATVLVFKGQAEAGLMEFRPSGVYEAGSSRPLGE